MKYIITNESELDERTLRREHGKIATRTYRQVFLSLVVYTAVASFAVSFIIALLNGFIGGDSEAFTKITESSYFTWGLQVFSMYLVALPVFLLEVRKIPKSSLGYDTLSFKEFMSYFCICEAVMLIGNAVTTYITSFLSTLLGGEIENATSDLIMESDMLPTVLVVVIIGPIAEEIIFRKVLIDKLGRFGNRLAIIVSAVAFGLFHGNLNQLLYATLLGLVLGCVYTKTGKLIYTCLLHMMVNFMGTVPALISQDSLARLEQISADAVPAIDSTLITDVCIVGSIVLIQYVIAIIGTLTLLRSRSNGLLTLDMEPEAPISPYRVARCAFFNIGVIFFVAMCVFEILVSTLLI